MTAAPAAVVEPHEQLGVSIAGPQDRGPVGHGSDSREFEVLRLLARTELPTELRHRVREHLEAGVDWEVLWDGAGRHGLLPFLHRGLEAVGFDDVPEPIVDTLRDHADRTARRNLYLTAELVRLLGAWGERGVAALPFKGPVVADTLYPVAGLRAFSDLDVLVRPEDVGSAIEVLESRGFKPHRPLAAGQERAFRWGQYAHPYDRPADGVSVDLHWRFAPSWFMSGVRMERIWESTEPWSVHGTTVRRLSPEATMLALCLHGAKHGPVPWPRLIWLCDVAALSRSRLDEGEDLLGFASSHGCRRIALLGLWLARRFLDAPLPTAAERALRDDPTVEALARPVERGLREMRVAAMERPAKLRWELRLRERRRDRVRVFVHRALMPRRRDREAAALPSWLAFLYVPIRVCRVALQYLSPRRSDSGRALGGDRTEVAPGDPRPADGRG